MKKLVAILMILSLVSCSLSAGDLPEENKVNTEVNNSNDSSNE